MSRFFSEKYSSLIPYTPGEQPKDMQYIKLNTNESPFPPSERAIAMAGEAAKKLELYPDPECQELVDSLAKLYNIDSDQILLTNGSDEILNFAFMAFCDKEHPAVFADITYGFYKVFADIDCVPYEEIPLKSDFSIKVEDYIGINKTIFIANPNAPTGLVLTVDDIERIIESNPNNVVVVDEAYVDFGAQSCIGLINKYDNLLVTRTFSKSRSMAGARLGFGAASKTLINDLKTVKYSTNPYNINRMTMAAGLGTVMDEQYTIDNCRAIIETREYASKELKKLGFEMTNSATNFIFARHPKIEGKKIYVELKKAGILVRHFDTEKLCQYNRITVGTREQMDRLITQLKKILEE